MDAGALSLQKKKKKNEKEEEEIILAGWGEVGTRFQGKRVNTG